MVLKYKTVLPSCLNEGRFKIAYIRHAYLLYVYIMYSFVHIQCVYNRQIIFNLDQMSIKENVYGRRTTDENQSQQLKALVADLLFCCKRDFMMSLSDDKQAVNTTSRYLDDSLNIIFILTVW